MSCSRTQRSDGCEARIHNPLSQELLCSTETQRCCMHPQGGTLIFSHIRRLGLFFGVQILNFDIFWGFQKNEYFLGLMEIFFFEGHHKIGLVCGSLLSNLGSFLRSRYRIGIFFWVAKISNIFWGA